MDSTRGELEFDSLNEAFISTQISQQLQSGTSHAVGFQVTCFTEIVNDVSLHFQIIRLSKQIYAWIGCNSANLGQLYAAALTRPNNVVSVTSILGGTSDNIGAGIARRLVLKTGLNIVVACNIPKNNPMIEANAEKILVRKLIDLGYTRPKPIILSSSWDAFEV